jgi:hypothetical protein
MEDKTNKSKAEKIAEGVDYYFENGLMVLTEHYLRNRGYCCNNGCRHCPYPKKEKSTYKRKVSSSSLFS